MDIEAVHAAGGCYFWSGAFNDHELRQVHRTRESGLAMAEMPYYWSKSVVGTTFADFFYTRFPGERWRDYVIKSEGGRVMEEQDIIKRDELITILFEPQPELAVVAGLCRDDFV